MKYKILSSSSDDCAGGVCPTFWLTDNSSVIIQGNKISTFDKQELNLQNNEDAVEIPLEVFAKLIKKIK